MVNDKMMAQMSSKDGFIAALDQSGGSTPGALRLYGIPDSDYSGDAEMFRLMHDMRVRIITAPTFSGAKVIAAILFERRGPAVPESAVGTFRQFIASQLRPAFPPNADIERTLPDWRY